jgi:WD40 repeat protein
MSKNKKKPSLSIDTSSIFSNDPSSPSLCQLQNAVLNPHNGYEVVVCGDRQLAGYDTRTNGNSFRMKGHAHESTVRAIDYNPNKPYHIATGGDDSLVRIWDSRNLTHHLMEIKQHTHWVWDVAFNKLQDQLLLTSSSDTLVSLYNTISVSSASYLENEDSSGSDEDDGSDDYDSYR